MLGLGLALALELGLDLAIKVILTTTSSTFTISNVHTPFDASDSEIATLIVIRHSGERSEILPAQQHNHVIRV